MKWDGIQSLVFLTGGQDISKRCPQRFLGSSVTNRYIPFSQKANERIRDLGELIRNLYQQWGVICIELFRSNTPKSLCCKEFSQLVPLSGNHDQLTPVTLAIPRQEIRSSKSLSINCLVSSETVLLVGLITN